MNGGVKVLPKFCQYAYTDTEKADTELGIPIFCFENVLDGLCFIDQNFQNLKSKTSLYFESNLSKYWSEPSLSPLSSLTLFFI